MAGAYRSEQLGVGGSQRRTATREKFGSLLAKSKETAPA